MTRHDPTEIDMEELSRYARVANAALVATLAALDDQITASRGGVPYRDGSLAFFLAVSLLARTMEKYPAFKSTMTAAEFRPDGVKVEQITVVEFVNRVIATTTKEDQSHD